jgi:hypothetical protein
MVDEETLETIRDAVYASLTADFATARAKRPATVPVTPMYDRERDLVVVSASPAFAEKAQRAADNPNVSLLLHTAEGRLHVTGRATVDDDDLEANAAVVEQLLHDEPETPKRAAMTEAAAFLETRLGRWLLDWYGLRILVEIAPETVAHGDGGGQELTLPPWPEADVSASEAERYDQAVATIVDDTDTPRTWPLDELRLAEGRLALDPPEHSALADGQPACVLVHWHTDDLSGLEQRLVRGRCRTDSGQWTFEPASSTHLRNRTGLDFLRFVVTGKRRTRSYYAERGVSYW